MAIAGALVFHKHILFFVGISASESGGAGTSYIESRNLTSGALLYQKISIDNNGNTYPRDSAFGSGELVNLLNGEYTDISRSGGVTWLYNNSLFYSFQFFEVSGNAHVAILSNTQEEVIDVRVTFLSGDRTGVLHAGKNQTFGFTEVDVYMAVNLASYRFVLTLYPMAKFTS